MKADEKEIAHAIRIEVDEQEDRLFIIFEVIDPKAKKDIKTNWIKDIEYKLVGKSLIKSEE